VVRKRQPALNEVVNFRQKNVKAERRITWTNSLLFCRIGNGVDQIADKRGVGTSSVTPHRLRI